jgi:beta-mannanase
VLVLFSLVSPMFMGISPAASRTHATAPNRSQPVTPAGAATTSKIALGFYTPPSNIQQALSEVGGAAILNFFASWSTQFPGWFAKQANQVGAIPMITWEPNSTTLDTIIAGRNDPYIRTWARAAMAAHTTIDVRFAHEMNGKWYPWGEGVNSDTPAKYVAAWRHVVKIFRAIGATNVSWVWCIASGGDQATLPAYFPGESYVDWVAMDGYNRNISQDWDWFSAVFGPDYGFLTRVSSRPVMIAETASVEDPALADRKASWIKAAFLYAVPTLFPRIRAVLYFDGNGSGVGSDLPWTSSKSALAAMKAVFASPLYQK